MPGTPMDSRRDFPSNERSVADARWFVRKQLESWAAAELVDSATLVTSELVTNAVVHAGTAVQVRLRLDGSRLRLEVQDQHPSRVLAVGVALPPDDSEGGRGLAITAAVAASWGVDYTPTAKRVWVELVQGGAGSPRPPVAELTDGHEVLVAVVALSDAGLVRSWNDDAVRLLGWQPDEVVGGPWDRLVDGTWSPGDGLLDGGWHGELSLHTKGGAMTPVFATGHGVGRREGREGTVLLLVSADQRQLLHRPATTAAVRTTADLDPAGLPDEALTHLGLDDFLDLALERCRDRVGADATYLLLLRDFDSDLEVTALSGLDAGLRGQRVDRDAPGAVNRVNARLPLVETELADGDVPLLAGTALRSLLVVPVVVDGRVVGALGAATEAAGGLDDTQTTLLQQAAGSLAVATDRARLRATERERRHWLSLVDEAGVLLAGSLDQQMTMALTGQVVVPQLASWCAIHLHDQRGRLVLEHVWHEDEQAVGPLRAALEPLEQEQLHTARDPLLRGPVQTLTLTARGRDIGTLTIGRPDREPLTGEILRVAESLARRAAVAIDNAHAHGELQAAGEALQRSLLPPSMPDPPGLDVGVVYEPAGESSTAGGDFYDLFLLGDGRWCWVIGDVCGTGAEAAAVTGLARHTIRALALAGFPAGATLERLNSAILDEGERARFLTLACGVLDPAQGGRIGMSLVVAGHPSPFLVRQGEVRQVGRPQSLLGVEDHVVYAEDRLELRRGDLLVAVTDGVLERREGDRILGEDGVAAQLLESVDLPAQTVADRLRRLVLDFVADPHLDDMAILAIRVPGP